MVMTLLSQTEPSAAPCCAGADPCLYLLLAAVQGLGREAVTRTPSKRMEDGGYMGLRSSYSEPDPLGRHGDEALYRVTLIPLQKYQLFLCRYNGLLEVIAQTLKDLLKALKGLVVMSSQLELMANSLYNNAVPAMWNTKVQPSCPGELTRPRGELDKFHSWAVLSHTAQTPAPGACRCPLPHAGGSQP